MPFSLVLPPTLARQGWRVKIRENERSERPHVTIIRGLKSWRFALREREFMDRTPPPREVPDAVVEAIEAGWAQLCAEWDAKYPLNLVRSEVEGD